MSGENHPRYADVVVIGGGQSGLAAGFYLQRLQRDAQRGRIEGAPSFVILDAAAEPGGAWKDFWPSMELFSPAEHSSLPGRQMPAYPGPNNPDAKHVVDYLTDYEQRYGLPIKRPVRVSAVELAGADGFLIRSTAGDWRARYVISATGNWDAPYLPEVPGRELYAGKQLHTRDYRGSEEFVGQDVVVVGAGNSGAQIAADLLPVASSVMWATLEEPRYMADHVDGRALFDLATIRKNKLAAGEAVAQDRSFGNIVAVPAVRQARDAGRLVATPMFDSLSPDGLLWDDGSAHRADAIIWCTGFRPNVDHLAALGVDLPRKDQPVAAGDGLLTRSSEVPGLYLLGYGEAVGPASATLIGVGSWARDTVADISARYRAKD